MLGKKEAWSQLKDEKPLVIAGPCSAETEEQVLQTAIELKKDNRVSVFRAGIWKPRTRPGSFEGVGSIGLPWLQRVKKEVGMDISVEVANVKHVYEALKAGVDILWIGARTTANPFAVQEIADALQGVDIPVLVKNPVNPDVALWMGAIERLHKAGINRLGAIHRGVSQFEKSMFRNNPEWAMPIQLREQMPDLLLINDPSHIAGKRELIANVSQKALDLQFDGLMIETHIDPLHAWSDAAQQVTPERLSEILDGIILRSETPKGVELKSIQDMRSSINYIDNQIIDLLSYRMDIVRDIAEFKSKNNMSIFQEGRWNELVSKYDKQAEKLGLSPEFVSKIFHQIHLESIEKQNTIINKGEEKVKV
jgi:chorismate mutase